MQLFFVVLTLCIHYCGLFVHLWIQAARTRDLLLWMKLSGGVGRQEICKLGSCTIESVLLKMKSTFICIENCFDVPFLDALGLRHPLRRQRTGSGNDYMANCISWKLFWRCDAWRKEVHKHVCFRCVNVLTYRVCYIMCSVIIIIINHRNNHTTILYGIIDPLINIETWSCLAKIAARSVTKMAAEGLDCIRMCQTIN